MASGLSDKSDERQANTLLYCLGADAEDILSTTNISTENRKKYQKVLEKFDEFFAVRRNVIFERETTLQFYTSWQRVASTAT